MDVYNENTVKSSCNEFFYFSRIQSQPGLRSFCRSRSPLHVCTYVYMCVHRYKGIKLNDLN